MTAILVDLDGALGDTHSLWHDWLTASATLLGVDASGLAGDRAEAAAELDAAGAGNWRSLLERFAEERAPVYLRPDADAGTALRRLAAANTTIGVFTDAPVELAQVALSQLGATRRVAALEAGSGALERLQDLLGREAPIARTREELVRAAA